MPVKHFSKSGAGVAQTRPHSVQANGGVDGTP